jgi:hypothetical protein
MASGLPASFGLLNQRLDPGAGEGQGPEPASGLTQTHPFFLNSPGQSSGPAQVASGVDPSNVLGAWPTHQLNAVLNALADSRPHERARCPGAVAP